MNALTFCAPPIAVCAAALAVAGTAQAQTPSAAALPEVVISASRLEQAMQSAPIGATVLQGDEIRESGVLDANEAVRKLAAVPSRSATGGREATLDLRGYGEAAQQNLVVVIDGIRITENELASARLSAIAPEMIERIEIVRGGASASWGEGAAGGVIHVITRRPRSEGVHGTVALTAQSWGLADAQATLQAAGTALVLDARLRHLHDRGWRDNSADWQTVATLGLQSANAAQAQGWHWRLGYHDDADNTRFAGALTPAQALTHPRQSLTPDDYARWSEQRASALTQWRSGPWLLALDAARRQRSSSATLASFAYSSTARSTQSQLSPRLSYQGELAAVPMTAMLGYDDVRWEAQHRNNYGQDEDATQRNRAWYLKWDALLSNATRLTLGWRRESVQKDALDAANYVRYSLQQSLPAWDAGVNHTLAPGWDAYARAAKSFRLGNVDENRYTAGPLRPTLAWDHELGLKLLRTTGSASVRVFRQRSVDEIAYDPIRWVNINQDEIVRHGLEFEGRLRWASRWDTAASVQWIRARFSGGPNLGRDVPLVPRTTLTARLGWAASAAQRLELALTYRSAAVVGGDTANACERVPASTRWDARYTYKLREDARGWSLSAALENLTNRQSYSNAYSAGCAAVGVYPEPGRSLKLQARYAY